MVMERVFILVVLGLIGFIVYLVLKQGHMRQLGQVTAVAANVVGNTPTLLYFGSESCAACPTQWRYLEQLTGMWNGRLTIEKIDAENEPDKAAQYHIFTLPTTVIVDKSGIVREINYGLTHTQKLKRQLEVISDQ
jgi:thioredoxin-like negative regulator of GroEL